MTYTKNVHVFGCSIFRNISVKELKEINELLNKKFGFKMIVVSQEEEASLTAYGCYNNIDFSGNICVFIGGGGSIELLFIKDKEIIDKKYYDFGVVDITKAFPSLKEDIPSIAFEEVSSYIESLLKDLKLKCDILILAGGDHLYWYNNARYKLSPNSLYKDDKQPYMITIEDSNKYDKDMFKTSLNAIRNRSDNPLWFDGSRAMKFITYTVANKVNAKYVIPTKINMEDGLSKKIIEENYLK